MDKNAIKKYAVWARRELIEKVSQKALQYGIEDGIDIDPSVESINGILLTDTEKKQRQALIKKVKEESYSQVIEEVAYTWFNRFVALRFMEVNGYLPSHVRVFSDENNSFKPQILVEALHLEFENLDKEKVIQMKQLNQEEELFKYLLIVQCNDLSLVLPRMFQKIADYTELLLPDFLLRENSVIQQLVECIPQEDWQNQVQIIGWLYQYYNSELKDDVFDRLKKNIKISKNTIPAATQLFTPDWIVRYMVENSLGKIWLEGHYNKELRDYFSYYVDEAPQKKENEEIINNIKASYREIKPEDIRCLDPCMGSGHVLVCLFDVLIKIYENYGYSAREAVPMILKYNLYGLDIDERAAQLAYFAVMMMARKYDRRIFNENITPNIFSVSESNNVEPYVIEYFSNNNPELNKSIDCIIEELHDAKEYGSILKTSNQDWDLLENRFREIEDDISINKERALELKKLVNVARILAQKYHVVVTNPPYLNISNVSPILADYVKKCYPETKNDLFSVFIQRCCEMTIKDGYAALVTQQGWMFLSSYEKLRKWLSSYDIISLLQLGAHAFEDIGGEVVQNASFVIRKEKMHDYYGTYYRLVDEGSQQEKEKAFLHNEGKFIASQDKYDVIPGCPVAYWVDDVITSAYVTLKPMSYYGALKHGMTTGKNDYCLKLWFEVDRNLLITDASSQEEFEKSNCVYVPYNKGGSYQKWYGNYDYVLGYDKSYNDYMDSLGGHRHDNPSYYYKKAITWSLTNSNFFGARERVPGSIFDVNGMSMFVNNDEDYYYLLALMCSKISTVFMKINNPTLASQVGDVSKIPVKIDNEKKKIISELGQKCVMVTKDDWDSFEVSWDFKKHPLIPNRDSVGNDILIKDLFEKWTDECEQRFQTVKNAEEEINRYFIEIYNMQNELTPFVDDADITLRRADLNRDIRSLISYSVGCMFGRYSLDEDGIKYAGGVFDYTTFNQDVVDNDNIIPICDDEYFMDDIVSKFVSFIRKVYGEKNLDNNLSFIAQAIGGTGDASEVIRKYFIGDFFTDHCSIYSVNGSGKRPIYWLFDSGKNNGFKCLVYMHRMRNDTLARIRTDYVHEQQARYRTEIHSLEEQLKKSSSANKVKLSKKMKAIKDQMEELYLYEEKIHHLADQMISIDLDKGMKSNYGIFKDVLAKIK